MVQVSYPGVYIQEVPSGVHTITGVSTSIAAFIGFFREGPMDEAKQIFGMTDFNRIYGGSDDRSEASYSISQFFLNGGTEAYIVRVASGTGSDTPQIASVKIKKGTTVAATEIMKVKALNEGIWGNNLRVIIDHNTSDPTSFFNMYVTRHADTQPLAAPVAAEKYLNLSLDLTEPRFFESVVNDESSLVCVEHLATSAEGLPASNGTLSKTITLTEVEIAALNDQTFRVNIGADSSGPHVTTLTWGTASDPTTLLELRPYLEQAIRTADPLNSPAYTKATVELIGNRYLVRSGRAASSTTEFTSSDVVDIATDGSETVASDLGFTGPGICENVHEYVLGVTGTTLAQTGGAAGNDGLKPDADAIKGDEGLKKGLFALKDVDLFNILCIPRAVDLDDVSMTSVVDTALKFCEDERAFMIIDIPKKINTVEEIKDWLAAHSSFRHKNAAVYFPRVSIPDAQNEYRLRAVGASGTIAGLYSRIDGARGVWKAPAGTEATLRGVGELVEKLTDAQNGTLNPLGINCLRTFPVYGCICWGSRTLEGSDLMASEWKYIPVRRLALFLEESLFRGTKWVVFEPNDEPLWAKIRLNLKAFMMSLFRQGAFQGSTPDKAFYVKCDGETTTQADINLGIVNIEVGFAPLKPAEFVVIKIQQIAGDL